MIHVQQPAPDGDDISSLTTALTTIESIVGSLLGSPIVVGSVSIAAVDIRVGSDDDEPLWDVDLMASQHVIQIPIRVTHEVLI